MKNRFIIPLLIIPFLITGCTRKDSSSQPSFSYSSPSSQEEDKPRKPFPYTEFDFEHLVGKGVRTYDGDYYWYSFTAPRQATYFFQSLATRWIEDGTDLEGVFPVTFAVIELFFEVVVGKNNQGFAVSEYISNPDGTYYSHIDYPLKEGETVFIRVRGEEYKPINASFKILDSSRIDSEKYHVHTGTRYVDEGEYHSLLCWHDDVELKREDHTYGDQLYTSEGISYRICTKCGHKREYKE